MAATDLNENGWADIVIGRSADYNSSIYLDYCGTAPSSFITTPISLMSPITTDIDLDGNTDLVAGVNYHAASQVKWGDGDGGFSGASSFYTGYLAGTAVADMDKNGSLDIAVSNYGGNVYMQWAEDNATRTSYGSLTQTTLSASQPFGIFVADLDNDAAGLLDVVVSNYGGNAAVFWNQGSKQFSAPTYLSASGSADVSAADFDKDGNIDVVITQHSGDVLVYRNLGNQQFSSTPEHLTNSSGQSTTAADLDNDGWLDIVVSNTSGNSKIWWGAETNPFSVMTPMATAASYENAIGDLDNDGLADIVFTNFNDPAYVYLNNGNRTFSQHVMPADTFRGWGVTIAGSNILTGNSSWGNLVPLAMTENDISSQAMLSAEYQLLSQWDDFTEEGGQDLDLSELELGLLAQLYLDGKAGLDPAGIMIDGVEWGYFSDDVPGHDTPSAWYADGKYYYQFGSGLTTDPVLMGGGGGGEVPEPSTLLLLGTIGCLLLSKRKEKRS